MTIDYYEKLGVSETASQEEIKKAFRQMSKKLHPDVNRHDPHAESSFKEINEAYSTLSDEVKRRQYDRSRRGQVGGNPFDGIFNEFFANFGGFSNMGGFGSRGFDQHQQGQGQTIRPAPIEAESPAMINIMLSFSQSYSGTSQNVRIGNSKLMCPTCYGTGRADAAFHYCGKCGGSGHVIRQQNQSIFSFNSSMDCDACRHLTPCP